MFTKDTKHFFQVDDVISYFEAFDQYVIYGDFHCFLNYFLEHLVNQSLVCRPCILHPKRHDLVVI